MNGCSVFLQRAVTRPPHLKTPAWVEQPIKTVGLAVLRRLVALSCHSGRLSARLMNLLLVQDFAASRNLSCPSFISPSRSVSQKSFDAYSPVVPASSCSYTIMMMMMLLFRSAAVTNRSCLQNSHPGWPTGPVQQFLNQQSQLP